MRIYCCDHCGTEVQTATDVRDDGEPAHKNWANLRLSYRRIGIRGGPQALTRCDLELCPDCFAELHSFLMKQQTR